MILEYCNGGNLDDLMNAKGYQVTGWVIHKIICQLVQGLHDMMQHNIIHRDLKLENIMIHFPQHTDDLLQMNPI